MRIGCAASFLSLARAPAEKESERLFRLGRHDTKTVKIDGPGVRTLAAMRYVYCSLSITRFSSSSGLLELFSVAVVESGLRVAPGVLE